MTSDDNSRNGIVSDGLHPAVYRVMAGLAVWFVVSVWALFDQSAYTGWILTVVSGFVLISLGLPIILACVRREEPDHATRDPQPLRRWAGGVFEVWQGRLGGTEAMLQVLLPIAAVAFGMTAFGIALHVAEAMI